MSVIGCELPSEKSANTSAEAAHKIVVIDDDPASIELVSEVLQQPRLEIIGVTDAPSGLALVRSHRPEMVILDLVIPDVKGLELLEKGDGVGFCCSVARVRVRLRCRRPRLGLYS